MGRDIDLLMVLLHGPVDEPEESEEKKYRPVRAPENPARLERVAPGPWTSIGGYLDYSTWGARERFLELDKAIGVCSVDEGNQPQHLPAATVAHDE